MITIHQGDQLSLPLHITYGDNVASPDVIAAIRASVGHVRHEYPNGELTFDGNYWLFPLTAAETNRMQGATEVQAEIIVNGDDHVHSFVETIMVNKSRLRGIWNE